MFLLKTNGKKWSNSEVSVLQGNRGRFTWYLTQCLKHTAFFPHEFYSPKHSEEHTADNNTRSIIHSVPNFISSPLFLNVHTHAVHVPSPHTTHTYKMRGGVASLQTKNLNMRRVRHTFLTHMWNRGNTHTDTDGVPVPGGGTVNELLPERSSRDARPQQRWSWRDGWRVRPRGGHISSY